MAWVFGQSAQMRDGRRRAIEADVPSLFEAREQMYRRGKLDLLQARLLGAA